MSVADEWDDAPVAGGGSGSDDVVSAGGDDWGSDAPVAGGGKKAKKGSQEVNSDTPVSVNPVSMAPVEPEVAEGDDWGSDAPVAGGGKRAGLPPLPPSRRRQGPWDAVAGGGAGGDDWGSDAPVAGGGAGRREEALAAVPESEGFPVPLVPSPSESDIAEGSGGRRVAAGTGVPQVSAPHAFGVTGAGGVDRNGLPLAAKKTAPVPEPEAVDYRVEAVSTDVDSGSEGWGDDVPVAGEMPDDGDVFADPVAGEVPVAGWEFEEEDSDEQDDVEVEVEAAGAGVGGTKGAGAAVPQVIELGKKPAPKKRKSRGQGMPGGIRMTDRDYGILTFLGRYRLATISQLARRFETSETALRNRLPRLEKAGFLTWAYTGQTKPKVWTVTETGLRVAQVSLGAPQIKWGTLRHTLGLVDLGITFEQAGELVVTEREIRAAATRYSPTPRMRTAIDLRAELAEARGEVLGIEDSPRLATEGYTVQVQGKGFGHIPDMVLVRQPFEDGQSGSIAIELELHRKTLSDWKSVLTAYRDSFAFAQVVYYIVDTDIERALLATIKALGADHKIHVVRFTPIDRTAEPGTDML